MKKKELVKDIARKTGVTEQMTRLVVETMLSSIGQAMREGQRVSLVGFGTFEPRSRHARMGVDPRTFERIPIKQSVVPAFRAGKNLKATINDREYE